MRHFSVCAAEALLKKDKERDNRLVLDFGSLFLPMFHQ